MSRYVMPTMKHEGSVMIWRCFDRHKMGSLFKIDRIQRKEQNTYPHFDYLNTIFTISRQDFLSENELTWCLRNVWLYIHISVQEIPKFYEWRFLVCDTFSTCISYCILTLGWYFAQYERNILILIKKKSVVTKLIFKRWIFFSMKMILPVNR